MSKSKGNVLTPTHIFEEFSADAYRYWAARNRLGTDTIFDNEVIRVGKRLCTKLFNASRFVIMQLDRVDADFAKVQTEDITASLDIAFVAELRRLVERASQGFAEFDHATPLQVTDELFWQFCDDYVELVKVRSYGEDDTAERRSAIATLHSQRSKRRAQTRNLVGQLAILNVVGLGEIPVVADQLDDNEFLL